MDASQARKTGKRRAGVVLAIFSARCEWSDDVSRAVCLRAGYSESWSRGAGSGSSRTVTHSDSGCSRVWRRWHVSCVAWYTCASRPLQTRDFFRPRLRPLSSMAATKVETRDRCARVAVRRSRLLFRLSGLSRVQVSSQRTRPLTHSLSASNFADTTFRREPSRMESEARGKASGIGCPR